MAKDKQTKEIYEELATEEPERKIDLFDEIEEDGANPKSLSEKVGEAPELSDLQAAIARLFPEDLGDEVINKVMVARVAPDVFIPLLKMLVNEEIIKSDPQKPISVATTVAKLYTLLSIGLDGKGRIDHIELAGASKEQDELKELGKGLFG